MFPPKLAFLLTLISVGYFLLSFAPVIWPAVRAFRRANRLSRPWLFVGLVACFTYGVFSFFIFALMLPAQAYTIFIAPQLEEAGWPSGHYFVRVTTFIADYWWIALPPAQLLATFFVTRRLSVRWERICSALST
jgi:hypothetical protein